MDTLGLTSKEAESAHLRGEGNHQPDKVQKTTGQIFRENLLTYFNLIFAVLAVLLIIAGAYRSLTLLIAVIFNSAIGIVQQLRAKKVLDELAVLSQPTAVVYRDGRKVRLPIEQLVLGDVVCFKAGSQICADAQILSGEVNVNESLLTGESDEVPKKAGDELLSGSFVVSGNCNAKLTKVGNNSYIAKLTREAKEMPGHEQSEMVKSIDRFVMIAGIVIIPIGILLFIQGVKQGNSFSENVTSMVAAVTGMIPEGLYILVSMTLFLAAARLARQKILLHDMKSIETLARVDVLCVDKTGTITDIDMEVEAVILPEEMRQSADRSMYVEKEAGEEALQKQKAGNMLAAYLSLIDDENATSSALKKYFPHKKSIRKPVSILPFTSQNKFSAVIFDNWTYVLGAPDIILKNELYAWQECLDYYTAKGLRVILFAKVFGNLEDGLNTCEIEPLLFVALQNRVRENAAETFAYFSKQAVEIKVISGDAPSTVSFIAAKAGIDHADRAVDARTLTTTEEIEEAVEKFTVFGRVTPVQKKQFVEALQKKGHTVAMTGDGVNDIMAMKAADCSIAMASGSDAAVQASQVALMDSDFSHMPQIVSEGRRIVGNIERSATLFLTKNLFSFLMAVFSIMSFLSYPLLPEQISMISGFNIGIPAFLLAMEPNEKRITGHFMSKVILRAMPAALTDFFSIAALVMFGIVFEVSDVDISVAATFLLAIVGFIILFNISQPLNKFRGGVIGICIVGLGLSASLLHDLYSIQVPSFQCFLLFVLFAIATEPCMRYLTQLFSYLEKYRVTVMKRQQE